MNQIDSFRNYRWLATRFQGLINATDFLTSLESIVTRRLDPEKTSTIFIIGTPRTGSTLLLQLLLTTFEFSYITNLSSLFYTAPALVTKISKPFSKKYKPKTYRSTYGFIDGIWSPSEAGPLFQHWFENPGEDKKWQTHVRKSVASIIQSMGGPFLLKNMRAGIRLDNINRFFPDALYIYVTRNPLFVAQSIINVRRKLLGDVSRWWSIKPPNYKELIVLDPFEQVALQIKSIEATISQSFQEQKIHRVIYVNYEDLCSDFLSTLGYIEKCCMEKGMELTRISLNRLDSLSLDRSEKRLLSAKEWNHLVKVINRIF